MTSLPTRIETITDDLREDVARALGWVQDPLTRNWRATPEGANFHVWFQPHELPDFLNSIDAQTRRVPGIITEMVNYDDRMCKATAGSVCFEGYAKSEPRARLAALLRAMGVTRRVI